MFTDEDLKRMNQEIIDMDVPYDHPFQISTGRLKLIFARLEAAEMVITGAHDSSCGCYEVWRKAAGRDK